MMNKISSARVHLIKFLFAIPIVAVLLLAFRQDQDLQTGSPEQITSIDTLPQLAPAGREAQVNQKGFILSVADNQGECIVIVKDRDKKMVKAVLLTDWNKDESYEKTYGKIPPPPPPPAPPASPIAPEAPGSIALMPPPPPPAMAPPPPPPPPRLPANVRSIDINDNAAKVKLKNGKTESYDLQKPAEKAAFEKKYGEILPEGPEHAENPEPSAPVPSVAPNATPVPAAAPGDETVSVKASSITIVDKGDGAELSVENQPVYYIDGKEATKKDIKALAPDDIGEIRVFKGKMAFEKYGEKGKNGVIELTLKKSKKLSLLNPSAISSVEKDKC